MIKKIINIISGILVPLFIWVFISESIKDHKVYTYMIPTLVIFFVIYLASGGDEKYKYLPIWKRVLRLFLFPVIVLLAFCTVMFFATKSYGQGIISVIITLLVLGIYYYLFEAVSNISASTVDTMNGLDFEHYCAKVLSQNGYEDVTVTPASNDYGADIIAFKKGEKWVVQCKRYSSPLGNTPIQEVVAAKNYYQANKAAVMTNSVFTKNAESVAKANNVLLIDGTALSMMSRRLGNALISHNKVEQNNSFSAASVRDRTITNDNTGILYKTDSQEKRIQELYDQWIDIRPDKYQDAMDDMVREIADAINSGFRDLYHFDLKVNSAKYNRSSRKGVIVFSSQGISYDVYIHFKENVLKLIKRKMQVTELVDGIFSVIVDM